jgi:hypothetical protein
MDQARSKQRQLAALPKQENRPARRLTLLFILCPWVVVMVELTSCSAFRKSPAAETVIATEEVSRIVFLNYSIVNDTAMGNYKIRLINQIISEGKLKDPNSGTLKPEINDLDYLVLDEKSNLLSRKFIANPLNKELEYVSEEGQLAVKFFQADSAQFSLRIQLEPKAKYIVLEKYTGIETKNIHLLTSEIH